MRDNNEAIDKVIREIIDNNPLAASNAIGVLLLSVRRLNVIVDDLNKEIKELKREHFSSKIALRRT